MFVCVCLVFFSFLSFSLFSTAMKSEQGFLIDECLQQISYIKPNLISSCFTFYYCPWQFTVALFVWCTKTHTHTQKEQELFKMQNILHELVKLLCKGLVKATKKIIVHWTNECGKMQKRKKPMWWLECEKWRVVYITLILIYHTQSPSLFWKKRRREKYRKPIQCIATMWLLSLSEP